MLLDSFSLRTKLIAYSFYGLFTLGKSYPFFSNYNAFFVLCG